MASNFRTGGVADARWTVSNGVATVNCSTSGYNFIRYLQSEIGAGSTDGIWGQNTTERLAVVLDAASQPQATEGRTASPRGAGLAVAVRTQGQQRAIGVAMVKAALWYMLWSRQNIDVSPDQIQLPADVVLPVWNVRPALPPLNARAIAPPVCSGDLSALSTPVAPAPPAPDASAPPADTSSQSPGDTVTPETSTSEAPASDGGFSNIWGAFGTGAATSGISPWATSPVGAPPGGTPPRPTGVPTTFFIVAGAAVLGLGVLGYWLMSGPTLSGGSARVAHARGRRGRKGR